MLAEANGVPIPNTYFPQDLDELMELDLQFPVDIKPSIRDNFYDKVKIKGFRIDNRDELLETYQYVGSIIHPSEVLVQDFIPGGPKHLYSFCPFFNHNYINVF